MVSRPLTRFALAALAVTALPLTAYAASEPAAKSPEYYTKKVCRVFRPTGTRVGGVRSCRTQADIDRGKAEDRQVMEKVQSMKVTQCPPAC